MAIASSFGVQNSHKVEHFDEAAGGDMQRNKIMNKDIDIDKESNIHVEMNEKLVEPGTGGTGQSRSLSDLIGQREILLLIGLGICVYLINGEYASILCTALTSIPPAFFSFRVLMNQKTTKEGYHSILFYWTVYGIFALIDQFAAHAQGYNLCKGGFLGTIFIHATRTNPHSMPLSWQVVVDQAAAQLMSSILTKYDSNGFLKESTSSHFVPRSPTMTAFSDDSEYIMDVTDATTSECIIEEFDYVEENLDVATACSFMPSMDMQSTQKVSPEKKSIIRGDTLKKQENNNNNQKAADLPMAAQKFASMSAMTITVGGQHDIVTIPQDRIDFSLKLRESSIRVTNVSPLHIMFALKTNADTYLIAAPTTGVLCSGQSITIRVGVTEQFFEMFENPEKIIDKLAIDYTFIPQEKSTQLTNFSHQYFQTHNRRRSSIRVFYH